jgi:hypothetical protein
MSDGGGKSACEVGDGKVIRESDSGLALLVDLEDQGDRVWIPKSVIHDDSEVFDADENARGKVVVMQWWAEANGLC